MAWPTGWLRLPHGVDLNFRTLVDERQVRCAGRVETAQSALGASQIHVVDPKALQERLPLGVRRIGGDRTA